MVDRVTPLSNAQGESRHAFDRIKADVDQFVSELDFQQIGNRVQEFGKQNPAALAMAALTIGLAAGLLMRQNARSFSSSSSGSSSTAHR